MPPLVLLPLLLVLLSCSSPSVLGGGADEHEYTLVALKSLKPKATCSGHRGTYVSLQWRPCMHMTTLRMMFLSHMHVLIKTNANNVVLTPPIPPSDSAPEHHVGSTEPPPWPVLAIVLDAASTAPSLAELLLHDQIRVDDIQMRLSGNPDAGDAKKRSAGGRTYQKFGNLLAVNFGGGRRRTSSSMVWWGTLSLQCIEIFVQTT